MCNDLSQIGVKDFSVLKYHDAFRMRICLVSVVLSWTESVEKDLISLRLKKQEVYVRSEILDESLGNDFDFSSMRCPPYEFANGCVWELRTL